MFVRTLKCHLLYFVNGSHFFVQELKILQKKVVDLEKSNSKLTKDLQKADDKLQTMENSTPVTKSKVCLSLLTIHILCTLPGLSFMTFRTWTKYPF
jgi:hypothetical protein